MTVLYLKGLALVALLATATAYQIPDDEDSVAADAVQTEDDDLLVSVEEEQAAVEAKYAELAKEHAELIQFRHEVMEMGFLCNACKKVAGYLQGIVKNADDKEEAKQKLVDKCNSLSWILKKACNYAVNRYFDRLYRYISNEAEPRKACRKVRLC